MKQLVVLCHPLSEKFCAVISTEMAGLYEKYKLDFELRDLYKMNFNPVVSEQDILMASKDQVLDDVLTEQEYIKDADLITFIYPIWSVGMPAMMKGYIDRVFSKNFLYSFVGGKVKKQLKKKKVVLINFFEQNSDSYPEADFYEQSMKYERQIFELFGMDVILQYSLENMSIDDEAAALKIRLEEIKEIIKKTLFISRNSRLTIPNLFF